MNDKVVGEIDKIAHELAKVVTGVAPQVWSTMLEIKRVDSIGTIVGTSFAILVLAAATVFCLRQARHLVSKYGADCKDDGICTAWSMCTFGTYVFPIAAVIVFWTILLNVWTWIGIFQPGLAVSHDLVSKVLGQ